MGTPSKRNSVMVRDIQRKDGTKIISKAADRPISSLGFIESKVGKTKGIATRRTELQRITEQQSSENQESENNCSSDKIIQEEEVEENEEDEENSNHDMNEEIEGKICKLADLISLLEEHTSLELQTMSVTDRDCI